jgi:hypothetical protein
MSRALSLCGKHKIPYPGTVGDCPVCKKIFRLMQKRNPCNTCDWHTNDEVCDNTSSCDKRRKYEVWRNCKGWNPQYDP